MYADCAHMYAAHSAAGALRDRREGGAVPTNESMTSTPVLGDYLAAAWGRRLVVLAPVIIGAVLGAPVVPLATSNGRTYAAAERVDVKAFGSEKAPSAASTA